MLTVALTDIPAACRELRFREAVLANGGRPGVPESSFGQLHVDASARDVNAKADDPSVRILDCSFGGHP